MKITAWFSFGVSMDIDDPEDYTSIAQLGRPLLIDRINSDGIGDCITDVDIDEEEDDGRVYHSSGDNLRYRGDGGSEQ